jgi:hypothetical protein
MKGERDDVEKFEEPDGGWQRDGINIRKTIHSQNPFTHKASVD